MDACLKNDPCVTLSHFVFKTCPYDYLAGYHQLMVLIRNPNGVVGGGRILLQSFEGEGGEQNLPMLWNWSREDRQPESKTFASKMFSVVSKFEFHVLFQMQTSVV